MKKLFTLGLCLLVRPVWAGDWPQFLGPQRDNTSLETVKAWESPLKPVWTKPVGPAHSSPVVAGGVVYAFYQPGKEAADALAAHDLKTGDLLWEKKIPRDAFTPAFGDGPRGTPTVADGAVYTLGGTGVLARWDAKSGEVKWKVDTLKEFQVENLVFGVSGSPLVTAKTVVVNVGAKDAGVVAFDRETGRTAWKSTSDGASYSSPILVKDTVVVLTKQYLRGLDAATGKEQWKYAFKDLLSESAATPLAVGDTIVGSSVSLGSVRLKPSANGVDTVWKNPDLNCYFSTPVLVGEHLYMLNGILAINPSITLRCVDAATGKVLWEKPKVGKYHAALVHTKDGKLLMLDDTGNLSLIQPDPKELKVLAKSKVCGATWAHPSLADGFVVIRDEKNMLAFRLP